MGSPNTAVLSLNSSMHHFWRHLRDSSDALDQLDKVFALENEVESTLKARYSHTQTIRRASAHLSSHQQTAFRLWADAMKGHLGDVDDMFRNKKRLDAGSTLQSFAARRTVRNALDEVDVCGDEIANEMTSRGLQPCMSIYHLVLSSWSVLSDYAC